MLRKLLYALLILIALFIIGGLLIWNVPEENIAKKEVDFTMTSTAIFEEFEANEKAASTKYVSKVIAVSGTIEDIMQDEKGDQVILIAGSDMGNGVMCTLEASELEKAKALKRGDSVTIKGRCSGMLMDVVLNKCTIQ